MLPRDELRYWKFSQDIPLITNTSFLDHWERILCIFKAVIRSAYLTIQYRLMVLGNITPKDDTVERMQVLGSIFKEKHLTVPSKLPAYILILINKNIFTSIWKEMFIVDQNAYSHFWTVHSITFICLYHRINRFARRNAFPMKK